MIVLRVAVSAVFKQAGELDASKAARQHLGELDASKAGGAMIVVRVATSTTF
jgi:hypothetical protein